LRANDAPYEAQTLLLDMSAFARARDLSADWDAALIAGQLVVSPPFLIEALFSTRNEQEYAALAEELTVGLDQVAIDEETWVLALAAQAHMAAHASAYHCRPPVDYLNAAAAHQHSIGVLHYDEDYDRIRAHGGLRFSSVWAAPKGTLAGESDDPLRPFRRAVAERLAQFAQPGDTPVYERVLQQLDREVQDAGLPPVRSGDLPG